MIRNLFAVLLCSFASTAILLAEDVKVDGVHLCCGKCVTGAKEALQNIDGISKIRVNKMQESVVFDAANSESAQRGLKSLAKAGFYGKPSIKGPEFAIDATIKKDVLSVSAMHLCCGGCVTAAESAIESVAGVSKVDVKANAGKIDVTGSEISLAAVLKALHEAGFHGEVK